LCQDGNKRSGDGTRPENKEKGLMAGNMERAILITGASSGIGEALALAYAEPGCFLALGGRDPARLEAVARACREKGAAVDGKAIDVADRETLEEWISFIDQSHPLDLVIANAGITADTRGEVAAGDAGRAILLVNVLGVWNTVAPVIPRMRARGGGQIALMSSLAGYRGLPSAPAYSASKAWVKGWGEALRGSLRGDGIRVSVICPGFVVSRITDTNRFAMPLIMDAERAAGIIHRGLASDRSRIAFPYRMHWLMWFLACLPPALTDRLFRRLPSKE
jgi:short-subunit dehydrogenase